MHHSKHPEDLYPKTRAAEQRARRESFAPYLYVALAIAAACIILIAVVIVLSDSPARGAADRAAVVAASTTPGIRVKQPEHAPPVRDYVPGDGTWLVGKEIKPGTYASAGGQMCYWERLSDLSGEYTGLIMNGGLRNGPAKVTILAGDFAFVSQGCGRWDLVQ